MFGIFKNDETKELRDRLDRTRAEYEKERDERRALEDSIKALTKEKTKLETDVEKLKATKKREEEEIKHHLKLGEEKQKVENERFQLKCEREKEAAIAKVKDEYRDKLEKRLETEIANIKGMYGEILERLPNVNVRLKGDV